ncbi:hypothetical protein JTB14_029538 [Gonioctena quinquepunctata]|nr:hypothetical protein JTB14_029538 [Gonioctena quinquepunctata]
MYPRFSSAGLYRFTGKENSLNKPSLCMDNAYRTGWEEKQGRRKRDISDEDVLLEVMQSSNLMDSQHKCLKRHYKRPDHQRNSGIAP